MIFIPLMLLPSLFSGRSFMLLYLLLSTGRPERFFTKLEQTHARNFLKEAVEHVLLAYPKLFVKRLLNTCLIEKL